LDKNGYIDLSELKASFFHRFEKMKQRKLTRTDSIKVEEATKKAHASMDLDADGKVDFEELFHFLCMDGFEGDPNDKVEVEKFLKKMDDNSYAELLSFIENYAEGVF
jgi:Ca2+-binding EF-hand superfamily protein